MSDQHELLCIGVAARAVRRASFSALVAGMSFATGCKTVDYTAANLPEQMRTPPSPPSNVIDLARMGGGGFGTSQIGPGDLVEVTIASGRGEEHVETLPARVAQDGTIVLPLVGPVAVNGVEPFEAERRIAAAAVERGIYRQPYVTLKVTERAVNRVTVLGAVAKPGVVELPRGSSDILSALAAAGGLTDVAGTQVDVLHQNGQSILAGQPGQGGATKQDGVVQASYNAVDGANGAGAPRMARLDLAQANPTARDNSNLWDRDVIMVLPHEKRMVHVTGLVHKPDQFEIARDQEMRVLDAIAMAGGTTTPLADKVYVIRQFPNMTEPAVIKVSIAGAKRNGRENLRLAPGDLVSVEATVVTTVMETATNFFRVAVGVSGNMATF